MTLTVVVLDGWPSTMTCTFLPNRAKLPPKVAAADQDLTTVSGNLGKQQRTTVRGGGAYVDKQARHACGCNVLWGTMERARPNTCQHTEAQARWQGKNHAYLQSKTPAPPFNHLAGALQGGFEPPSLDANWPAHRQPL